MKASSASASTAPTAHRRCGTSVHCGGTPSSERHALNVVGASPRAKCGATFPDSESALSVDRAAALVRRSSGSRRTRLPATWAFMSAIRAPSDTSRLEALITAADGTKTALERTGEHRFEARFPLAKEGVALGTLKLADGKFLTLPPVALPYSPEFEPSPDPQRGERLLRKLADESNGVAGVSAAELWRGERSGHAWRVISS